MNKRFGFYSIFWAVLLALFNVIAFVSPGWIWFEKYDAAFWIGYSLITITFLGQLACAWFALKEENAKKVFYRLSLFRRSYAALVSTFVFGGLCMLASPLIWWIGILSCGIILVANILTCIKTIAAVSEVERIDEKVKNETFFVKSLTVDADALLAKAATEAEKTVCKKLYEAVRYSDPVSCSALASVESEITIRFAELSQAVGSDDAEKVEKLAGEVMALLDNRNKKCKLLK